jgi:transposase InsO family protein
LRRSTPRLWRAAKLQVPRKRPRRRVAATRSKALTATAANHVWAYDFVFDACANGQQLKCLTVIDEYTREAVAIDVAGSIRSARVIEVLAQLVSIHGAPRAPTSDNGPDPASATPPASRRILPALAVFFRILLVRRRCCVLTATASD